jgi:hypothetical protein
MCEGNPAKQRKEVNMSTLTTATPLEQQFRTTVRLYDADMEQINVHFWTVWLPKDPSDALHALSCIEFTLESAHLAQSHHCFSNWCPKEGSFFWLGEDRRTPVPTYIEVVYDVFAPMSNQVDHSYSHLFELAVNHNHKDAVYTLHNEDCPLPGRFVPYYRPGKCPCGNHN